MVDPEPWAVVTGTMVRPYGCTTVNHGQLWSTMVNHGWQWKTMVPWSLYRRGIILQGVDYFLFLTTRAGAEARFLIKLFFIIFLLFCRWPEPNFRLARDWIMQPLMRNGEVLIGTLNHSTFTVHFHYVTNKSDRAIIFDVVWCLQESMNHQGLL